MVTTALLFSMILNDDYLTSNIKSLAELSLENNPIEIILLDVSDHDSLELDVPGPAEVPAEDNLYDAIWSELSGYDSLHLTVPGPAGSQDEQERAVELVLWSQVGGFSLEVWADFVNGH